MNDNGQPVLYALITGFPAARDIGELVDLAQSDGWDVCVIASPNGRRFIDANALSAKTGHMVRSEYKEPDAPDVLPPVDAMIIAPITCNSLAKWAQASPTRSRWACSSKRSANANPWWPCRFQLGTDQFPRCARRHP